MVSFSLHPCGSNPAGTKTPVLMFFFIGWFPQSCLQYEYVQQTSSNQHGFFRTVQGGASPFFRGILVVQVAKEEFGLDLASNAISLSLVADRYHVFEEY
jgi:hypothetical protein